MARLSGRQAVKAYTPDAIPGRARTGYFQRSGTEGKSTEEIIGFLREAGVRVVRGATAGKIYRGARISEQTY